jgi:hypothetical protein
MSRYGVHDHSTVLVLYFNAPLDPARAQDVSNYVLTDSAGRRIGVSSATYDATTMTVMLRPSSRLNLHRAYTLEVIGSGSTGLTGANGVALDGSGSGQPGTNFVTQVTWTALTVPGRGPAMTYSNGQAHGYTGRFNRYVNSILRATRSAGHATGGLRFLTAARQSHGHRARPDAHHGKHGH